MDGKNTNWPNDSNDNSSSTNNCSASRTKNTIGKESSTVVTFVHLDLGIGGAERLVVSLACSLLNDTTGPPSPPLQLQDGKYAVRIVTSHHDQNHCFDETKPLVGILSRCIAVYGDWLPRNILGKAAALCAITRMLYVSMVVIVLSLSSVQRTDVVVLDGVSAPIPLFYLAGIPVVFYCHYPDKLLCTDRVGWLKRLYRSVIDIVEELTTGCATVIVVNSQFTAGAFHNSFPLISRYFQPKVLYPTVEEDTSPITCKTSRKFIRSSTGSTAADAALSATASTVVTDEVGYTDNYDYVFVSLNRYERKKNIGLALDAFAYLQKSMHTSDLNGQRRLLVIAGGYDTRVRENVEYLEELRRQALGLGLVCCDGSRREEEANVVFRTSISGAERGALLTKATALLYTPDNEHFGIVPLEAMYAGTPVIAVASGGPLETVIHGKTGFLCAQDTKSFGEAMIAFTQPVSDTQRSKLLTSNADTDIDALPVEGTSFTLSNIMGELGRSHVENNFTSGKMRRGLIECLDSATDIKRTTHAHIHRWSLLIPIVLGLLAVLVYYIVANI